VLARLERTRCGATSRPRRAPRPAAGSRHVAADVRRAVWERDKGQCTYVSESGRRCEARRGLQYDHAREFARGGALSFFGARIGTKIMPVRSAEGSRAWGFESPRL